MAIGNKSYFEQTSSNRRGDHRKRLAAGHVGCVQHDVGFARLVQCGKRGVMVKLRIEQRLLGLDAGDPAGDEAQPGDRVDSVEFERRHIVFGQKIVAQPIEIAVPMTGSASQSEPRGGNAAARDRRDQLDVLGQHMRAVRRGVAGLRQFAQDGFGESGGARPAARESHQNHRTVGARRIDRAQIGIAVAGLQWRVLDMHAGASAGQQYAEHPPKSRAHHALYRAE